MKPFTAVSAACALCIGLACHSVLAQEAPPAPPSDPIAEQVLPPELILRHQKAISLSEAQKNAVIVEVKRAQGRMVDVQWDLQRALEPMVELLGQDKVDEPQLLAQLDKVLASEREIKRTHLTLAARLKNILTPEQQRTLRDLRATPPRPSDPARPGTQK